jgi:hypothetical protein
MEFYLNRLMKIRNISVELLFLVLHPEGVEFS